jgi:hypothetical protein
MFFAFKLTFMFEFALLKRRMETQLLTKQRIKLSKMLLDSLQVS